MEKPKKKEKLFLCQIKINIFKDYLVNQYKKRKKIKVKNLKIFVKII